MARPAYSVDESDEIRERLVQGALGLFGESGPEGLSLRKLASRMNVSHTLLYRYFENKEALFTSIRIASIQKLYEMLLMADVEEAPLVSRIRVAAQTLIQFGRENPKEYRFVFASEQPDLESNAALLSIRHQVFDHIVGIVENADEPLNLTMAPRVWVHLAWAMLHGILILDDNHQLVEGCTFDEVVESALEMLFGQAV